MDIKKRIKDAGFSLEEVGRRMPKPMSQQSMSALLKDDGNPTINKLKDIAEIIGIPLSELVRDETSTLDFMALIKDGDRCYQALSLSELESIVEELKGKYRSSR